MFFFRSILIHRFALTAFFFFFCVRGTGCLVSSVNSQTQNGPNQKMLCVKFGAHPTNLAAVKFLQGLW